MSALICVRSHNKLHQNFAMSQNMEIKHGIDENFHIVVLQVCCSEALLMRCLGVCPRDFRAAMQPLRCQSRVPS